MPSASPAASLREAHNGRVQQLSPSSAAPAPPVPNIPNSAAAHEAWCVASPAALTPLFQLVHSTLFHLRQCHQASAISSGRHEFVCMCRGRSDALVHLQVIKRARTDTSLASLRQALSHPTNPSVTVILAYLIIKLPFAVSCVLKAIDHSQLLCHAT